MCPPPPQNHVGNVSVLSIHRQVIALLRVNGSQHSILYNFGDLPARCVFSSRIFFGKGQQLQNS